MQVKLEKTFVVEAPGTSSWQILSDIDTVASCMPGAEITEQLDDTHYNGKVKAKVGPASMAFAGAIEVLGVDPEKRELRLTSKGQDSKGTSSAQMDLTAWVLDSDAGGSELKGEAEVTVNGKLASLGGRMMTQVADQILNQFGKNFAAKAAALGQGEGEAGPEASADAATAEAEEAQPINGLAFAWSVLVGFIKSLFGKKGTNVG
jgi:carbon monoxide dehydrogenase subunit G